MDATPAPTLPPPTDPAPAPAPRTLSAKAQVTAEKLVDAWVRKHRAKSKLEVACDEAREKVTKFALEQGVEQLVTKHGTINLQDRDETSWKGLAEHCLTPAVINALKAAFTKTSAKFFRALPSWSSK